MRFCRYATVFGFDDELWKFCVCELKHCVGKHPHYSSCTFVTSPNFMDTNKTSLLTKTFDSYDLNYQLQIIWGYDRTTIHIHDDGNHFSLMIRKKKGFAYFWKVCRECHQTTSLARNWEDFRYITKWEITNLLFW